MKFLFSYLFLFISFFANSQTAVDTSKVYFITEYMPMIANCAAMDTTYEIQKKCSQEVLLKFIYQNVHYPDTARMQGIEGSVVIRFVVNPDSLISDTKIVKDIGGGCGDAALYVVNALNQLGVKWAPGKQNGVPVKVQMTIPIKFKIKEIPPYIIIDRDTVYNKFDKLLTFKGGDAALSEFITKKLTYPASGNDSCRIGSMDLKTIIKPNGEIKVLEVNDFSNLGIDYQFEAINTSIATMGQWDYAEYAGRKVPADYLIRIDFKPTDTKCQAVITKFDKAEQIALAGSTLFNEGKEEEGVAKLTEALAIFPNNAEFLYARGNAYLEMQDYTGACEDLSKVKEILLVTWVDHLLPIICKGGGE